MAPKIFDFSGTPQDFIDLRRINRLQIDAAILTGGVTSFRPAL